MPAPQVALKILEFKYKMAKTHEEKRKAAKKISDLLEVRLCVSMIATAVCQVLILFSLIFSSLFLRDISGLLFITNSMKIIKVLKQEGRI